MLLSFPGHGAKGIRPIGSAILNRESPQAQGLAHWWPLQSPLGLMNLAGGPSLGYVSGTRGYTGDPSLGTMLVANSTRYDSASAVALSPPFTIAMWVVAYSTPSSYKAACRFDNCGFYNDPSSRWIWLTAGESGVITASPPTNRASLLTVTDDGVTTSTYLNGLAAGTTGGNVVLSGTLSVCGDQFGQMWDGLITDMRIYRRVLSPAHVWSLYDPATRWDLYWVPGRRLYVDLAAGGSVGSQVWWHTYGQAANL